jgi:Asp-tRNA(Asn)/Glu-tRNA(Gln) amidotransferase A subunit family amidase
MGRQLAITNLTGHPALVMPMGFNHSGSPLSITLLGNLYDEASIMEAGHAYQEATNHHLKHPVKFTK